jgi:hypothetical protein
MRHTLEISTFVAGAAEIYTAGGLRMTWRA